MFPQMFFFLLSTVNFSDKHIGWVCNKLPTIPRITVVFKVHRIPLHYERFRGDISVNSEKHWGQALLNEWTQFIRTGCTCSTAHHPRKAAVINSQALQMDTPKIADLRRKTRLKKSFNWLQPLLCGLLEDIGQKTQLERKNRFKQ